MNPKFNYSFAVVACFIGLTILSAIGKNNPNHIKTGIPTSNVASPPDTPKLKYPIQDRKDGYDDHRNTLDLKDPSNVRDSVVYDPETNQYILMKTIGGRFYREPTYMSFEEYLKYESKRKEEEYFENKGGSGTLLTRKGIIPPVNVNNLLMDRLFGGSEVDIKPQGNIELTFGGNYTKILNPSLTLAQQKQGGFNFDMNIQMNVVGKIGDKLKLTTNYNTQGQFDFEKQVKLEYTGHSDEIIKKIEAGNVSLPLNSQLITGSQSLFGLKTQLQFGRLKVTALVSQQKSQAQNIAVTGGQQTQTFSVPADQYDENRNFFLSQYFRDQYEANMAKLPTLTSPVNITKIEVWITNKTGATIDTRDIAAFMDLGENNPYNTAHIAPTPGNFLPFAYSQPTELNSNSLYTDINGNQAVRSLNTAVNTLNALGFTQALDYEKTYARKLSSTEYTFQPQLGYLMLNTQLNPDDILAVAYQYTYNGKIYQVGEFASDIPPNPNSANIIYLKLLKGTSVYPKLPIWDLMMKNVYSLGAFGINPQDFRLDVVYRDPGGGERRFVPADPISGTPLIRLLGLDKLNNQNDPQPDGIFDFIPGLTINPQNGKVIFPVLEPFGSALRRAFGTPAPPLADKYIYQVLYDSTKTIALQFPEFNRFYLKGQYKSSSSSDISLGAFNIPQGSVSVTAGGRVLQENVDYTVDYNLGRLKVINSSIMNSGVPINVKFENNPAFVFTQKTLLATRLDYYINDNFKLGGTMMRLSERPFTKKLNVGDDPIANTVLGIDANYKTDVPWLTKMIDKLPLIDTKDRSSITLTGEGAKLLPGHPKVIGKNGTVYIDDFEGTESTYDLKFPFSSWALASTPSKFAESKLIDDLSYGFKRAKFQWYNIDPFFYTNNAPGGISGNNTEQYGIYTRQIFETDIFPQAPSLNQNGLPPVLTTFDIKFDPLRRGPYNYRTEGINPINGNLPNPTENWGGIMRSLDYNDFEAANIGFVQFWVLYPYTDKVPSVTGSPALTIQLGNISEDILKDSRLFYENNLPADGNYGNMQSSKWSYFPSNSQPPIVQNAFDNNATSRQFQDVGYDGIGTDGERTKYQDYLNSIQAISATLYNQILADPSNDNFRYYRDAIYDQNQTGVIDRYQDYNNPDGNSPITSGSQSTTTSSTNVPESEDLNRDNTLNEVESYFQYTFNMKPGDLSQQGQNYITDIVETDATDKDGNPIGKMTWLQVKIPINSFTNKIGGIQDFKSIRFIRMFMDGFNEPVVLRFGKLELLRNQWRNYNFSLQSPGEYLPDENNANTYFNVTSVSFEANGKRQPVNYILPPGVEQQQAVGTVTNYLQNEQSLAVQVCNLADGDAKAAYKEINLDLRTYDSLTMFVHAESVLDQAPLKNGDITAFIRLGSDFVSNYYEYEVPLEISVPGNYNNKDVSDQLKVWPASNNFTVSLKDLTTIKTQRNTTGASVILPFTTTVNGRKITIVGNPDLGLVKTAMLGIRNPKRGTAGVDDNSLPVCAEVWFDELSVRGFDEQGGYAALARMDIKLADLGTLSISGNLHTIGFGSIDQKLDQRFKDNFYQYNASATLEMGRFIPKVIGLKVPMYIGITNSYSNPKYDPYELDVLLKDKLALTPNDKKDSVRRAAQDYTSIKSLNFTNVRRVNPKKDAKLRIYSIENLNFTYAYTNTFRSTPILESDVIKRHHLEVAYAFPGKSAFISPFNGLLGSAKSKYWKIIKDFNFNLLPTNLTFRTQFDRQYGETHLRPSFPGDVIEPTFNKFYTTDRFYGAKWDITRSLNIDFSATNNARIDEPYGRIDTREEKDSIRTNLKKLGRTTHYHQSVNASYTLPFSKLPILDWTNITARYSTDYDWLALPQSLDTSYNPDLTIRRIRQVDNPLGNTLSNTQNIAVNSDFNIRNLYGKWKWLKRYDTNFSAQKTAPKDDKKTKADDKLKNNNAAVPPGPSVQAFFLRLVISLKKVNFSYTQNRGSVVPGFVYRSKILGQDISNSAPGFDYIFGMQPTENWLFNAADKGWITKSTDLNYQFIQTLSRNLTARATFEPAKDLNIDLNFSRSYSENTNSIFRNTSTDINNPHFQLLNPQNTGTFTMTFISINTAFISSKDGKSAVFNKFSDYRETMSARWKGRNPNSVGPFYSPVNDATLTNYAFGYGPYSQEVLIPAFIAAYGGRNPSKVRLTNFFNMIPNPNWRISYNGLNKFEWAKKYFNNVSFTHAYTSTISFGNFTSSLLYEGLNVDGQNIPLRVDANSGNFVPFYDMQSISISERFSPLLGVDISWKGGFTTKLDFGKGRNVALSMLNYQLTETRSTDLTFNFGYKWKKFPIPFKIRGKKRRLKNDINVSLQLGYNKNSTQNYRLDLGQPAVPTQGSTVVQISPAIDYQVNSRLTVRLFLDKRFTTPATSASYPINYTSAGVKIRFTLQ